MKYKKGGIVFIMSVILTILLVAALSSIVFKSAGISITSIVENVKKLVNIETPKVEAGQEPKPCTIRRYYWSPENARFREKVSVNIEGEGNCNGKSVRLIVYGRFYNNQGKAIPWDNVNGIMIEGNVDMPFKDKVIKKEFILENAPDPGTYMATAVFTLEFGNFKARSDDLKIIQ